MNDKHAEPEWRVSESELENAIDSVLPSNRLLLSTSIMYDLRDACAYIEKLQHEINRRDNRLSRVRDRRDEYFKAWSGAMAQLNTLRDAVLETRYAGRGKTETIITRSDWHKLRKLAESGVSQAEPATRSEQNSQHGGESRDERGRLKERIAELANEKCLAKLDAIHTRTRFETTDAEKMELSRQLNALQASYDTLRDAVRDEAAAVDDMAGGYNADREISTNIALTHLRTIRDRLKQLAESGGGDSSGDGAGSQRTEQADRPVALLNQRILVDERGKPWREWNRSVPMHPYNKPKYPYHHGRHWVALMKDHPLWPVWTTYKVYYDSHPQDSLYITVKCEACKGEGYITQIGYVENHPYKEAEPCPHCHEGMTLKREDSKPRRALDEFSPGWP